MNQPPRRRSQRRRKKSQSGGVVMLLTIMTVFIGLLEPYVALILAVAMVPTLVLAMTGKSGTLQNDKLMTVLFLNLAGVTPFAVEVWDSPKIFQYVITDAVKISVMYGAAGLGYVLIWVGPMVAALVLEALAQDRLKKIAAERKGLQDIFGAELFSDDQPPEPKGL